jgi:hypothetical protein
LTGRVVPLAVGGAAVGALAISAGYLTRTSFGGQFDALDQKLADTQIGNAARGDVLAAVRAPAAFSRICATRCKLRHGASGDLLHHAVSPKLLFHQGGDNADVGFETCPERGETRTWIEPVRDQVGGPCQHVEIGVGDCPAPEQELRTLPEFLLQESILRREPLEGRSLELGKVGFAR